jgi:hypothetical protein
MTGKELDKNAARRLAVIRGTARMRPLPHER